MAIVMIPFEVDDEHRDKFAALKPIAPIPGNSLVDQIEKNRIMRKIRDNFIIMESGLSLTEYRAKLKAEGGENGKD